jgi:maltose alpha-D-glucosyltransferase/alpha-amylase
VRLPSAESLAAWLPAQRWFAGKAGRIAGVEIEAVVPLGGAALVVARVRPGDGAGDRYALPLAQAPEPVDVLAEPGFARSLLRAMTAGDRIEGTGGAIRGRPTPAGAGLAIEGMAIREIGGEQSNTSIAVGDLLALKQFRRLSPGINPEEEITRFLTERTAYRNTPRLLASLAWEPSAGEACALAVAHEFVAGAEDGWRWTLAELRELARDARDAAGTGDLPGGAAAGPGDLPPRAAVSLGALRRLGQRTGQLHAALASDPRDPAFAPEPITGADILAWAGGIHRQVEAARAALGGHLPVEVPDVAPALAGLTGVARIRHHGDFHLGQTLYRAAAGDFAIIDFEGEPLRPLAERRRKHAALRDVAGLRRSISYAVAAAAGGLTGAAGDAGAAATGGPDGSWRERWEADAQRAYVDGYLGATGGECFIPATPAGFDAAVAAFELEKAAYEIVYEANHRPAWVAIPVRGLVSAAARIRAGSSASA